MVGPSDLIGGRYRLRDEIASQGTAVHYKATDERSGRDVVVETLLEDADKSLAADVHRRARAVASLTHPGIARVLEVGDHDGLPYVVVELVTGRSLAELARGGEASLEQAITWCTEVLDALDHAHAAGVVHGDLRAGRVIVPAGSRATITGFTDPRVVVKGPRRTQDDLAQVAALLHQLTGGEEGEAALPRDLVGFLGRWSDPAAATPGASALEMRDELRGLRLEAAREDAAEVPAPGGESSSSTVWPIPGRRYDPTRLGRRVIAVALALALIALGAFLWRVTSRVSDGERPPFPTISPSLLGPTSMSLAGNLPPPPSVPTRP